MVLLMANVGGIACPSEQRFVGRGFQNSCRKEFLSLSHGQFLMGDECQPRLHFWIGWHGTGKGAQADGAYPSFLHNGAYREVA